MTVTPSWQAVGSRRLCRTRRTVLSFSPASLLTECAVPRLVLPSPNGSTISTIWMGQVLRSSPPVSATPPQWQTSLQRDWKMKGRWQ